MGVPHRGRRDRRDRPGPRRHRARPGDAADPVDVPGGTADAARLRVPAARLRLSRRHRRHDRRADRRGAPQPAALGAAGGRRGGRRAARPGRGVRALHRDRVRAEGHQRPPQPGLPPLHDPRRPGERLLMALPAPTLDDRRFQDLVNDAKRLVMRRCPEWTDHNVSDPGVTLIETFAFMTDQLLFRLNRVPDRLYLKFLDLIGLHLLPPVAASVPVTFWLSAPATAPLLIAAGTQAGTPRTETAESVTFATIDDLAIVPVTLQTILTLGAGQDSFADCTDELAQSRPFPIFTERPAPDDAVYFGLTEAA